MEISNTEVIKILKHVEKESLFLRAEMTDKQLGKLNKEGLDLLEVLLQKCEDLYLKIKKRMPHNP